MFNGRKAALAMVMSIQASCSVQQATLLDQQRVTDRGIRTADWQVMSPDGTPAVVPGTWVVIAPGRFSMGSATSEACRSTDEDQHDVDLTHAFELMTTEVTQAQFQAVMGYNPSYFGSCGGSCPVEHVTWYEAAAYCNKLSQYKGLAACYTCSGSGMALNCSEAASYSGVDVYSCPGYRLPTEAEWEYAYRAGTSTSYFNGPSDSSACHSCSTKDANADLIGWYCGNSDHKTQLVGQKAVNAWGLHDMAGNVAEWCHDWWQDNLGTAAATDPWGASTGPGRVLRGGYCGCTAANLRAANRAFDGPTVQYGGVGMRCSRGLR